MFAVWQKVGVVVVLKYCPNSKIRSAIEVMTTNAGLYFSACSITGFNNINKNR
jgi:hypothetical protein